MKPQQLYSFIALTEEVLKGLEDGEEYFYINDRNMKHVASGKTIKLFPKGIELIESSIPVNQEQEKDFECPLKLLSEITDEEECKHEWYETENHYIKCKFCNKTKYQ